VTRRPGEDARSLKIGLTRRGKTLAERVRSRRNDELASALVGLTPHQRTDLLHACELVVANLTRQRLAQRAAANDPLEVPCAACVTSPHAGRPAGKCPAARQAADAS